MSVCPDAMLRRDSWPPTQLRISRPPGKGERDGADPDLNDIEDDPLTYFLTPALELEDEDLGDTFAAFDAGIEDLSLEKDIVRSVSPSSLEGLSRAPTSRSLSPNFDSDELTSDDDDEDYIRFSPSNTQNLQILSLKDLAIESLRYRPRSPVVGLGANALLSPASYPSTTTNRGRSNARGRHSTARSLSAKRRSLHLWREPSPDVWSIREETEAELLSDMASEGEDTGTGSGQTKQKLKKKVRFLLPTAEV